MVPFGSKTSKMDVTVYIVPQLRSFGSSDAGNLSTIYCRVTTMYSKT